MAAEAVLPDGIRRGFFFPPTVLSNVHSNMKVMKEETFGPIIPLVSFENLEDVIKEANNSIYGLTASIWTKDMQKATARVRFAGSLWWRGILFSVS